MIKLTWGNLRDRDFMTSLGKLYGQPLGYEYGSKLAIIGREVKKQEALCNETHLGLLKKYGTPDKEKRGVFQLHDATREEFDAELKKMDAHEFTLTFGKFDAMKLEEACKFSPQDLMLLEPLLMPFEIPAESAGLKAVPKETPAPSPSH